MEGEAVAKPRIFRTEFYRSEAGYGWNVTLFVRGKHRVRWNSTRATTRTWPSITRGSDEDCNRAVSLILWPLGHLEVWWEPHWRPEGSGMCDECKELLEGERPRYG